jgi:hypothetical protein
MSEVCTVPAPALMLPSCTPFVRRILKHPRVMHYNRLVALVIAAKIGCAVYGASVAGWWTSAGTDLRAIVMLAQLNLAVAVTFRQQYVVNALAWLVTRPSTSWAAAGARGYRMVVSRPCDWTSAFVDQPPTHVWVRGIPTMGVANVRKLFTKVVLVATGSGIGPMLGHLLDTSVPSRLVWITKNPRRTYGDQLIDEIEAAQPDATIWDTDERGKPDVLRLAYTAYLESGAEAVVCIANKAVTGQVVHGLESRGIPAFGPIWDS